MNEKELMDAFDDANLRAESIIHIPAMITDYEFSPAIENELWDDYDLLVAMGLVPGNEVPDWTEDKELVIETIHNKKKYGWACKFATQIVTPHEEGGGYSSSWGHYKAKWFYADTYEATCAAALAWAAEYRSRILKREEA